MYKVSRPRRSLGILGLALCTYDSMVRVALFLRGDHACSSLAQSAYLLPVEFWKSSSPVSLCPFQSKTSGFSANITCSNTLLWPVCHGDTHHWRRASFAELSWAPCPSGAPAVMAECSLKAQTCPPQPHCQPLQGSLSQRLDRTVQTGLDSSFLNLFLSSHILLYTRRRNQAAPSTFCLDILSGLLFTSSAFHFSAKFSAVLQAASNCPSPCPLSAQLQ